MVLVNATPNSLNADFHSVPTVHLARHDAPPSRHTRRPPARRRRSTRRRSSFNAPAPFTAAFSSRGPLLAGGGDLLKPDVIAPGQDILAAFAPPGNRRLDFNLYSGTSMSSPHVAGLAALLKDLHPNWTPMVIKSALMTSASDVLDGPNTNPLVIFRQGAGHVRPNSAADPGLVYDHGFNDWLAFLCGTTAGVDRGDVHALQGAGFSLDPSNLNVASIAIGDLAGSQTVRRTVTNVGERPRPTASRDGHGRLHAPTVTPASLTLDPGETAVVRRDVHANDRSAQCVCRRPADLDRRRRHVVRIPLVVRPVPLAAPAEVSSTGGRSATTSSSDTTARLRRRARGLVAATTTTATVAGRSDGQHLLA